MEAVRFVDVETGEIVGEIKDPIQETLNFLSDENFRFTSTGVKVIGSPSFAHCEKKVIQSKELKRLAPIWLGDLLNYMECQWGDKYAQVLDPLGSSYQTAANAKSVMGRTPPEIRQSGLTMTHYKIAAPFDPPEQKELLRRAKEEGLNTTEFNHLARVEKRKAKLGILPSRVKMEMTATFEVPADLKAKMRDLAEGWTGRLWEWDIECLEISVKEEP
jgi:hypothetical protein